MSLPFSFPFLAPKVTGGSPQLILGGIGSWSCRLTNSSNHSFLQGLSPPATLYEAKDETLELIYAATGQVARLKRNGEDAALNGDWRAVSKPKQNLNQIHLLQNQKAVFYADQMKQKYLATCLSQLIFDTRYWFMSSPPTTTTAAKTSY
ncbi:unnamed protein product [Rhodiola kirilowii]